jgi:carbonic anhydrase/SulP family sulfate permease
LTAGGQHPLAVVLSCIDSRAPAELIFDLGVGEILSVRIAGNVLSEKVLGSLEYGCAVAGTKLVLVLGHTRCGAVGAAVKLASSTEAPARATGCQHIDPILREIQQVLEPSERQKVDALPAPEKESLVNEVARRHVRKVVETILRQSATLSTLAQDGRIAVIGAMYDVASGDVDFLPDTAT